MEQTTQQISQKPHFPIKTKIAIGWQIIIITFLLLFSFTYRAVPPNLEQFEFKLPQYLILYLIIDLLLFIIPVCLLLKRMKIGWWLSVILLSLHSLTFISFGGVSFAIFVTVIPLILLLLDRKNFFKIAS